jgi:hypothetical protein
MNRALGMLIPALLGGLQAGFGGATLQWQQGDGFQWAELDVPKGGRIGFRLMPPEETGIGFTNTLDSRAGESNRVLFNGSGVGVGDYNNDGLPDIYFCSLNGHNTLYQNLGGLRFKMYGGVARPTILPRRGSPAVGIALICW